MRYRFEYSKFNSDKGVYDMANCKGCNTHLMTWALQKAQFGRLINSGYTEAEAKEAMPRCQKCTTRWKRGHPINVRFIEKETEARDA